MSEDLPRTGDTITPRESADLMRQYAELSLIASQAREVVRGGQAATALRRLRDTNRRIKEKIDAIEALIR
jgi:hypothetical protein